MKKNLEQQEKELEEKFKQFEAERDSWEEQNRQADDQYVTHFLFARIQWWQLMSCAFYESHIIVVYPV